MNLLERLDESPPFLCYYLTHEKGKHPGIDVIAQRSGLSIWTVERLAKSISWGKWRLSVINRFCNALGFCFVVNIPSGGAVKATRLYFLKPHKRYLEHLASGKRKNPLNHLDSRQKRRFVSLCQKWKQARATV